MKKIILVTAILIGSIIALYAGGNDYIIGEDITFKSEILEEERSITVFLPRTYGISNREYPVLYLLDGRGHFLHASGIVDFLSAQGLIPEMIVVAVNNTNRNKDFTPTHLSQRPESGGAEKFTQFFSQELFPFMERNYRIGEYNILMGHSLGGTYATYVLLNSPDVFNSYISISPYLMYDNNLMVREAQDKLKPKYNSGTYYSMTVGNEANYFEALDTFSKTMKSKSPKGLTFSYTKMLEDDHGSVPHLSIYNGLLNIYSGWKLEPEVYKQGLEAIDKHYKKLSKIYNYEIYTSENTINQLGYIYMTNNDFDKAILTFKENTKRFPNSSNVYDSLGEAYEKNGDLSLATVNYQKAVKLATKENNPNLDVFKRNLERTQN